MKKVRGILQSAGGMNALSSVMAVLLGLLAGFVILLISDPSKAVKGFVLLRKCLVATVDICMEIMPDKP